MRSDALHHRPAGCSAATCKRIATSVAVCVRLLGPRWVLPTAIRAPGRMMGMSWGHPRHSHSDCSM